MSEALLLLTQDGFDDSTKIGKIFQQNCLYTVELMYFSSLHELILMKYRVCDNYLYTVSKQKRNVHFGALTKCHELNIPIRRFYFRGERLPNKKSQLMN